MENKIEKIIICDNGDKVKLSFLPGFDYIPQTATEEAKGCLKVYINDIRYENEINVQGMLMALRTIDILEFYNSKHAIFVLKGLIKIAKTYHRRYITYCKNN